MVLGIKGYLLATVIQSIMILKLVIPLPISKMSFLFLSLLSKKIGRIFTQTAIS